MNVKNNKRKRESIEKIEKAFVGFLQTRELKDITVSDICKETGLNRSTFYANFLDVYDLADKICQSLENDFSKLFSDDSVKKLSPYESSILMFRHIKENRIFYKTYFKLGGFTKEYVIDPIVSMREFGNRHIKYHVEFFKTGLNAVIQLWIEGGCQESPEEMADIIKSEYRGRR